MVLFEIQWKNTVEKEIRRIDRKEIPRLIKAIDTLKANPFPSFFRKLQGAESTYRIPISDYRIVYQVDLKAHIITIQHIRHRKDAYR